MANRNARTLQIWAKNTFNTQVVAVGMTAHGHRESYRIPPISLDRPGIEAEVVEFFRGSDINVEEMQSATYAAFHTGIRMFLLDMLINPPQAEAAELLREPFIPYSEAQPGCNTDAKPISQPDVSTRVSNPKNQA